MMNHARNNYSDIIDALMDEIGYDCRIEVIRNPMDMTNTIQAQLYVNGVESRHKCIVHNLDGHNVLGVFREYFDVIRLFIDEIHNDTSIGHYKEDQINGGYRIGQDSYTNIYTYTDTGGWYHINDQEGNESIETHGEEEMYILRCGM